MFALYDGVQFKDFVTTHVSHPHILEITDRKQVTYNTGHRILNSLYFFIFYKFRTVQMSMKQAT